MESEIRCERTNVSVYTVGIQSDSDSEEVSSAGRRSLGCRTR